jgi:hypothetical protein
MGGRPRVTIGERSGTRTVLAIDPSGTKQHMKFLVRCDCGKEQVIAGTTFRATRGCKKCSPGGQGRKYGDRQIKNEPVYHSWVAMRRRCNPLVESERNAPWAGRGIKVCKEWDESFEAFERWAVANGFRKGLSIDRINVDGNYEPSNCEWVTRSENSKRCRAEYHFIRKYKTPCFYDEACFGDF